MRISVTNDSDAGLHERLLPQHHELLRASSIGEEVSVARGYFSATSKSELESLGFREYQQRIPALVIPIHDVHGKIPLHQIRPDKPRITKGGKELKYESPAGSRLVLDVPPTVRPDLRDPRVPLWITEGSRKVDSATSAGLCCIGVVGVWGWRGKNESGGTVALPCWEVIALNGRRVYLCFDSDVMRKPEVRNALVRLKAFLESRRAQVQCVYLPEKEDGSKVGLDDYLADHSVEDLMKCVESTPTLASQEQAYLTRSGATYHRKPTPNGPIEQQLCNFVARIVAEEVKDDGVEESLVFALEGSLDGGTVLPHVEVPAERFASLSWIPSAWGTRAIVRAGTATKDHLRCAIQTLSGAVPRTTVYTHLGWRRMNGEWAYLHAGGAIGAGGALVSIHVAPPGALERYEFPAPTHPCAEAVRASLSLLEVAPDCIMVPLLSMVYRSVIDSADFSGHASGPTGAGKTELAALMQAHYGPGLDARHLPGSWSSTGNALEGLAFAAKDALLVVDDFAPHGSTSDIARQHREADRVLRAQGNRSGRARMWADGRLRQVRPPRGLILSTGEDVPAGQSLRARVLVVEVGPADVQWTLLTKSQRDAAEGRLAGALAGFIRWLAPRLDKARQRLKESVTGWRERSFSHRRSPDILGHLEGGFDLFIDYAVETEALSKDEARELRQRVIVALLAVGRAQAEQQQDADPVSRFLVLLAGALASGEVHVADAETNAEPIDPGHWGWRARTVQKGQLEKEVWDPQGPKIGWLSEDDVYLESEAVFGAVQRLAGRQGASLALSPRTLWKRMAERQLLVSREKGRYTARPTIAGRQHRAIHIRTALLSSGTGLSGLSGQNEGETPPEGVPADSQPGLQPSLDYDRATDRAGSSCETPAEERSHPTNPVRPVSPLTGDEVSAAVGDSAASESSHDDIKEGLV